MKPTLTFTRDSKNVKRPLPLKNGVLLILCKKIEISTMKFKRNDTELKVTLPEHNHVYFTLKFELDEIETVTSKQQRIWVGILNRSLTETILIQKKKQTFWIFVLEPSNKIDIKHETAPAKNKNLQKISKKKERDQVVFRTGRISLMLAKVQLTNWAKLHLVSLKMLAQKSMTSHSRK